MDCHTDKHVSHISSMLVCSIPKCTGVISLSNQSFRAISDHDLRTLVSLFFQILKLTPPHPSHTHFKTVVLGKCPSFPLQSYKHVQRLESRFLSSLCFVILWSQGATLDWARRARLCCRNCIGGIELMFDDVYQGRSPALQLFREPG